MARIIVKDGIEFKDVKLTKYTFSEYHVFLSLFGDALWYIESHAKTFNYPLASIILYENHINTFFDDNCFYIISFDISSKLHDFSLLYKLKGPFFEDYPFHSLKISTPFLEMTTQEEKELKEVFKNKNLEFLGDDNFDYTFGWNNS